MLPPPSAPHRGSRRPATELSKPPGFSPEYDTAARTTRRRAAAESVNTPAATSFSGRDLSLPRGPTPWPWKDPIRLARKREEHHHSGQDWGRWTGFAGKDLRVHLLPPKCRTPLGSSSVRSRLRLQLASATAPGQAACAGRASHRSASPWPRAWSAAWSILARPATQQCSAGAQLELCSWTGLYDTASDAKAHKSRLRLLVLTLLSVPSDHRYSCLVLPILRKFRSSPHHS